MNVSFRNKLFVGGIILVAASAILYQKSGRPTALNHSAPVSHGHRTQFSVAASPVGRPPISPATARQDLPAPVLSPYSPGSAADGDWTAARIAAIHDLEWFDDADSLQKILAELRNPLPQIRTAALEATRAFGSRDAIPHLAKRAAETGDLLEQKALIDLIEHLKLPTVVEQLEEESGK